MSEQPDFESWWEKHGQYGRAGGGQYEKTFAYNAWREQAERVRVLREALTGLLDLFHEGQVTARDEASGYVQAAVSAGERTLEATK